MKLIERYNQADILQADSDKDDFPIGSYFVDGMIFAVGKIEELKNWIDEVNANAKTTEFRKGKFVNKS